MIQSKLKFEYRNQKALTVIHYPRSLFKGSFGDAKYSVATSNTRVVEY